MNWIICLLLKWYRKQLTKIRNVKLVKKPLKSLISSIKYRSRYSTLLLLIKWFLRSYKILVQLIISSKNWIIHKCFFFLNYSDILSNWKLWFKNWKYNLLTDSHINQEIWKAFFRRILTFLIKIIYSFFW